MRRTASTIAALAAVILATQACTHAPPPGVPVSAHELSETLDEMAICGSDGSGLRGSGRGELSVSGRDMRFAYAFIYSRPGWLRADLRPDGAMMPGGLTTLLLVDGRSAVVFMPNRMMASRGTADELTTRVPWADHPAVAIGVLNGSFLSGLDGLGVMRRGDHLTVHGTLRGADVTAELAESPARLLSLTVSGPEGTLSVSYSGHGWNVIRSLPKTVEVEITTPDHNACRMKITHGSAEVVAAVPKDDYLFDIPDDATLMDLSEFDPWRTE